MQKNYKLPAAIFATGILSFGGVVIETAMNVTFPQLMKLFNVSLSQIQWVTTAYLLVLTAMIPLSAFLKKRFSSKKLFISAVCFFLLGIIIDAAATNLILLILGRAFQGIGTGISLPLMFNIILEKAPANKLGLLMGLGNFVTATAPAFGPIYGGILTDSWGWRMIFILMIPLILVALLVGCWSLDNQQPKKAIKFDFWGWLTTAATFAFLITAFNFLGTNLINFIIYLLLAVIFFVIMLFHYRKTTTPILNWSSLKNLNFNLHLSSYFIGQFVVLGLSFLIPNLIQLAFHRSSLQAGIAMAPGALLGALLTPFGGSLLDHLGAKRPVISGISLQLIAVLLFAIFFNHLTIPSIAAIFALFAAGQSLSMPGIMTHGLQQLSLQLQADGNALLNTFQQFAGAAGTAIISTIVAASASSQNAGFHNGLIFTLILLFADLGLIWTAFKKSN